MRYSSEASRHTHTTSASYLDLLKVYHSSIGGKREQAAVLLERLKAGLAKLKVSEDLLEQLEVSQLPPFCKVSSYALCTLYVRDMQYEEERT
jgi:hypothetical protein